MTTTPPDAAPGPAPEPPPAAAGPRTSREEVRDLGRLRRSTTDRKVAGVAGGLARHLDVDPVILRVALVVLVFFGGAGLLLYGAAWLLVPEDDDLEAPFHLDDRSRTVALTVVGVLALLAVVGDSWGLFGFPWPLAVVALLALLFLNRGSARPRAATEPAGGDQAGGGWATAPLAPEDRTRTRADRALVPPPVPRNPRRRGPVLFWFTLALAALGIGVLGLLDQAGVPVAGAAYPALVVTTCGAMLVLGSFWGRAGGLVAVGVLAAFLMVVTTAAAEVDGTSRTERPPTAAGVATTYEMEAGEVVLDLTDVADLTALDGRRVVLDGAVGRLEVVVPDGLDVRVEAQVGVGDTVLFGADRGGFGTEATASHDGGTDAPTLTLEARLGVGEVEVRTEGGHR